MKAWTLAYSRTKHIIRSPEEFNDFNFFSTLQIHFNRSPYFDFDFEWEPMGHGTPSAALNEDGKKGLK